MCVIMLRNILSCIFASIIGANMLVIPTQSIQDFILNPCSILIVFDNKYIECDKYQYDNVICSILSTLDNSHETPSLGVSLNYETRQEKQSGLWIELLYSDTQYHNEMPFDKLLIKINPDDYGLSIIRHYNNKYDGRCYYINLSQSTKDLYDTIFNIIKKD